MTAWTEVYCVDCNKPASGGGMVFVENKGYPICKEHWDFGHKLHQIQVKWPKHRHKYIQACEMCGKGK